MRKDTTVGVEAIWLYKYFLHRFQELEYDLGAHAALLTSNLHGANRGSDVPLRQGKVCVVTEC